MKIIKKNLIKREIKDFFEILMKPSTQSKENNFHHSLHKVCKNRHYIDEVPPPFCVKNKKKKKTTSNL